MIVSERTLKWALRFYPPLFFQRIWVQKFEAGFYAVHFKILKSSLNTNYNRSIFGGTIYSAADPFYAICFYQILKRRGLNIKVWVKSARIDFLKPAYTSLHSSIYLQKADIEDICSDLASNGRCSKSFSMEILDTNEQVCATISNEVYIRMLPAQQTNAKNK